MIRNIVTSLFIFFVVLIGFQNCSEFRIQPINLSSQSTPIPYPKGTLCAESFEGTDQKIQFIFIIDMSLSNLGNIYTLPAGNDGYQFRIDTDTAMDLTGKRFHAVNDFIDSCGNQPNASYQVIGFSSTSIFGEVFDGPARSCMAPFTKDPSLAKKYVQALKGVQQEDRAKSGRTGFRSPFTMSETLYATAFKCLDSAIAVDLASNINSSQLYKVFFLTDGKPTEFQNTIEELCSASDEDCKALFAKCTLPKVDTSLCISRVITEIYFPNMLQTISDETAIQGSRMSFTSLYYGPDAEYLDAKDTLDRLTQVTEPQNETLKITDINNLSNTLCSSLKPNSQQPYQISNLHVVNLTAIEKDGLWLPDSDMDGIPDENDDDSTISELLKTINSSSLDNDKDGLLDFIENIKGFNSHIQDSLQSDYDGDGLPNLTEAHLGTNPKQRTPFDTMLNFVQLSYQYNPSSAVCSKGQIAYDLNVSNLPFADQVKAIQKIDENNPLNINHGDGENLYLIYYIASPIAKSSDLKNKVFATTFKLSRLTKMAPYLQPSDFILLGELP